MKEKGMKASAVALAAALLLAQAAAADELEEWYTEWAKRIHDEAQPIEWRGQWKIEIGPAQAFDEAHIRMVRSYNLLRIIGLAKIEDDEKAEIARQGIASIIEGKNLHCGWLPEATKKGNPMAASEDGRPIASCTIWESVFRPCEENACRLEDMAVSQGYQPSSLGRLAI